MTTKLQALVVIDHARFVKWAAIFCFFPKDVYSLGIKVVILHLVKLINQIWCK